MNNCFEYKGYHSKIEYDYEGKTLFGTIDGIQDLVTFESENANEIEIAFHEAVDDYLAFCEEVGKDPEKEYKGTFNVRISPELHRKASIKAYKDGVSLNQFVQQAIQNEVNGRITNNYHFMLSVHNTKPDLTNYSSMEFKPASLFDSTRNYRS